MVRIEYFHHTMDRHVVIEVPRSALLVGGDFIVNGIERYGARVLEDDISGVCEAGEHDDCRMPECACAHHRKEA